MGSVVLPVTANADAIVAAFETLNVNFYVTSLVTASEGCDV